MNKKFTKWMAAALLLLLITPPMWVWGQASVNTTLWEETWTGGTTGETPSAYGFEGTTVYGGTILTYAQSSTNTKLYNETSAGGTAPELLLSKSNQTWAISNIPTGQATEMSLTFLSNKTTFAVTSTTNGITISGSQKSWTISVTESVSNFNLTIMNTSSKDNARIDNILLKVTTAGSGGGSTYTVTYDANGGTGTMTDDNSPYPAGESVTVLGNEFTRDNYTFDHWNTAADNSGTSYDEDDTFTINANTTLFAQWSENGGGGGSNTQTLTFDVSSNPGGWPTTNSSTLTNYTYTLNSVAYTFALKNVKCNSGYLMCTSTAALGLPAIEGYKLTKVVASNSSSCSKSTRVGISSSASTANYISGGEYQTWNNTSSSYTYNLSSTTANTVYYMYVTNANAQVIELELTYEKDNTPQFIPTSGTYAGTQNVTINAEDGASIYYTTDGSEPSSASTLYTGAITVSNNQTLKAIAIKGGESSPIATATYTILEPLTTMEAIFNNAYANTSSHVVGITFNNWVVTGTTGTKVYVTDGTRGFEINQSDHGFTAGNVLSGSTTCNLSYQTTYGYAQVTGLTSTNYGLSVGTGGTVVPVPTTLGALTGANVGSVVTLNNVTYTKYAPSTTYHFLNDGENYAQITNSITPSPSPAYSWTENKTYNVTGLFWLTYAQNYDENNLTTKRINPRSPDDIEEVSNPELSINPTTANPFTYVLGSGPSTDQTFEVTGTNLTSQDIVATITSGTEYFEVTDDVTYSNTVTVNSGDYISIRLKASLAKGSYNGTLTLSSTDATDVTVALSGTVTGQTYAINIDNDITGGTIAADLATAEEGATVTLTATPDAAYNFSEWMVLEADQTTEVTVTNNQFTMPACQVYVTAEFTAKPTNAITCVISPIGAAEMVTDATNDLAYEGQLVTLTIDNIQTGYTFSGIVITKTEDGSATGITPTQSGDDYTFTMPGYAVTATATFLSENFDGSFSLFEGELVEGDYLIVYDGGAMNNTISSKRFGYVEVTESESNVISNPSNNIVWHIAPSATAGYWTLYNAKVGQYAASAGTNSDMSLESSATEDGALWSTSGTYEFRNKANENSTTRYLRRNGSYGFANYSTSTGGSLTLYKKLPDVAPTWTSFPTTARIITGANYELAVSDYVSGTPNPTITVSTSATGYTLSNGTFTFTTSTAGEYAFTFTATNVAGSANVTLTITVSNPAQVTYRYSNNGVLEAATSIIQGQSIALATGENLNSEFTFVGWTDNLNDVEHNIHAPETSYQVNDDVVLYAVYANEVEGTPVTTYNKVTSISEGDYLIVYETGNLIFDGSLETLDAVGNTKSVTIIDGAIESNVSNDAAVFTISEVTGGYSIQSVSGYYIGQTSDANGLATNTTTAYTNTISINYGNADIVSSKAHLRYNSAANQTRFRYYKSSSYNSQEAIQLYKKGTSIPTTTEYYTHVLVEDLNEPTDLSDITNPVVIPSGVVVDAGSYLTNNNPANLIIEDGGQVFVNTSGVQATVKKAIAAPAKDTDHWYTISSPVNNIGITSVTNLVLDAPAVYDLYRYNEPTHMWENYKNATAHADFTNLTNGRGYLYYNSTGDDLAFSGELNASNVEISLTANSDKLTGFNLIGNPYSHDVYKGDGTAIVNSVANGYELATGFYTLTDQSAWEAGTDNSTVIKSGQGFLVQATTAGTLTITNTNAQGNSAKANNEMIQFTVANGQYKDVAYALFDEAIGLNKIEHINPEVPMLYIAQNGQDYAIATMERSTTAFDLNLNVATAGEYTLSAKALGSYDYLHLFDRMTGIDIDLLATDKYTFNSKPRDYMYRFEVRLSENASTGSATDETFAFFANGNLIINNEGEATLQVIDMTGRVLRSEAINGSASIGTKGLATGVYVLRLVNGNNIKTQKMVLK